MKWKVAITMESHGNEYEDIQDYLRSLGFEPCYRPDITGKPADVIERLKDVDAVIVGGDKFNAEVLNVLSSRLKIIARFGIGYDNIDISTASSLGIPVTNTPGLMSAPVADMAIALLFSVSRRTALFDKKVKSGDWWIQYVGTQLENKTVGLIGFGNISQKLAQYLQGFNCNILAYDIFFNENAAKKLGVKRASLNEIAAMSDFISVHLPLTDETRNIVDATFFNKMKKEAFLINTSRGGVVNEAALIEALKTNKIAGAGIDVFEKEPVLPDNPLLMMDNVVVTPHIAAHTKESTLLVGKCAADNIFDYYQGKTPRNVVNPEYAAKFSKR